MTASPAGRLVETTRPASVAVVIPAYCVPRDLGGEVARGLCRFPGPRDSSRDEPGGGRSHDHGIAIHREALQRLPLDKISHARNLLERVFYAYFLHDFSIDSVELVLGTLLLLWGLPFGVVEWIRGAARSGPATAGTVMLAALPVILGVQFLLGFLQFDYRNVPTRPLCARADLAAQAESRA